MTVKKKTEKQVPNPVLHAFVAWLSHSSSWSLIIGVVLAFVAVFAPTWAAKEELQSACTQLGLLLAAGFSILGVGQKIADGLSKGRTSAFTRHGELVDKAEEAAWEAELALEEKKIAARETEPVEVPDDDPPENDPDSE